MKDGVLKKFLTTMSDTFHPNGRVLAGAIAVGGVIATAILAYQCRPKVEKAIQNGQKKRDIIDFSDETPERKKEQKRQATVETVKDVAVAVLPTVVCGTVTTGLVIGAIANGEKEIQHWMGTAAMGDIAYKELYDKTKELVGEEKAKEIQAAADKEAADRKLKQQTGIEELDNLSETERLYLDERIHALIIDCGGHELWYDVMGNRFLYTSRSTIEKAISKCNQRMYGNVEPYITLNEFYSEAGWPQTVTGDDRAWGGHDLMTRSILEPNMQNSGVKGEGAYAILDWMVRPRLDYRRSAGGDLGSY